MPWSEVFIVLLLSHLTGDFVLQTDWQAEHKHGGLGADGEPAGRSSRTSSPTRSRSCRRSSGSATSWAPGQPPRRSGGIFLPHLIQDDGRLIRRYIALVKGQGATQVPLVLIAVDQTFHFLDLFGTALLAQRDSGALVAATLTARPAPQRSWPRPPPPRAERPTMRVRHGWASWTADLRHAARGQPRVPGEEAQEHAHQ